MTEISMAPGLELLGPLHEARDAYFAAQAGADAMEEWVRQRRAAATLMFDEAITQAGLGLVNNPPANNRARLGAMIRVSQHKPSTVVWSGPPDLEHIMGNFDALVPGAPVLLATPASSPEDITAGIVTDDEVLVTLKIMEGMGGLPGADITFGMQTLQQETPDGVISLVDHVDVLTMPHGLFGTISIGSAAIQRFIDTREILALPGHGRLRRVNHAQLGRIAQVAVQLHTLGHKINTAKITGLAREAAERDKVIRDARAMQIRHRSPWPQRVR